MSSVESPEFYLIYLPGFPGRGEHIRLVFETAGVAYTDTALLEAQECRAQVTQALSGQATDGATSPSPFAPPILRHGNVNIWQTSNILLYLGPLLNLSPLESDLSGRLHVNALTLTALDGLLDEAHDVHHPIAKMQYYEEQKDAALRRSVDYRMNRLPKYLGYFERVLGGESTRVEVYLYGDRLTYADLVLFQTLDGLHHAFPKAIQRLRDGGKYVKVFTLYDTVKNLPNVRNYLNSTRRQNYGNGIYRHYPELDDPDYK